jgi:Phage integrase, N-terminal SAM-like domain
MVAAAAMQFPRYVTADRWPVAVFRESVSAESAKPKLLDRVRHAIRARHYSRRTEKAYVHWIKRYIFFWVSRSLGSTTSCAQSARSTCLRFSRGTKSGQSSSAWTAFHA